MPFPDSEPIVVNVPTNGIGHAPEEMISEVEHVVLKTMRAEMDALRQRQGALQKELTLVSADFYRKQDELEKKALEVAKKYNLLKGQRELDISTGRILRFGVK